MKKLIVSLLLLATWGLAGAQATPTPVPTPEYHKAWFIVDMIPGPLGLEPNFQGIQVHSSYISCHGSFRMLVVIKDTIDKLIDLEATQGIDFVTDDPGDSLEVNTPQTDHNLIATAASSLGAKNWSYYVPWMR